MSSNSGEKRRWQKKKGTNLANNENIESLKKVLSAEFRKAEATLKVQELELFDRGLLMPAVNQLRYAGSHLIRTLDSSDQSKIESNLRQAIAHCQRATFDSLEVQVRYYLEHITILSGLLWILYILRF